MPPTQAFRHAHLRRPRQALRPFNVKLVGEEQILRGKFFSVMHLIFLWRWTTLFAAIGVVVFSPSARSKKVCTDACLSSERMVLVMTECSVHPASGVSRVVIALIVVERIA